MVLIDISLILDNLVKVFIVGQDVNAKEDCTVA